LHQALLISVNFAQKMKQKPLRKLLKGDSKEAATILKQLLESLITSANRCAKQFFVKEHLFRFATKK
jgi:hypothetical protein